jgi:hypothetical protein
MLRHSLLLRLFFQDVRELQRVRNTGAKLIQVPAQRFWVTKGTKKKGLKVPVSHKIS